MPSSAPAHERRLAYYGVTGGPPGTGTYNRTGLSGDPYRDRYQHSAIRPSESHQIPVKL